LVLVLASAGDLTQIQFTCLAGQAAVPGEKSGQR
jgi:hypothetical protein